MSLNASMFVSVLLASRASSSTEVLLMFQFGAFLSWSNRKSSFIFQMFHLRTS